MASQTWLRARAYWNGAVAVHMSVDIEYVEGILVPEWIVALAALIHDMLDRVRTHGGCPNAEYALKFAVDTVKNLDVRRFRIGRWEPEVAGELGSLVEPPIYPVRDRETFSETIDQISRDFFNSIGVSADPIELEFE